MCVSPKTPLLHTRITENAFVCGTVSLSCKKCLRLFQLPMHRSLGNIDPQLQ
jgi:hypothetical protein